MIFPANLPRKDFIRGDHNVSPIKPSQLMLYDYDFYLFNQYINMASAARKY